MKVYFFLLIYILIVFPRSSLGIVDSAQSIHVKSLMSLFHFLISFTLI